LNNPKSLIPLYQHTLDSLLIDLINGQPILLEENNGEDAKEFTISNKKARSILNWYRQNQNKWGKSVRKDDLDIITDESLKDPPSLKPKSDINVSEKPQIIHLNSVHVHRFAGIHRYGSQDETPKKFFQKFKKPLTVIQGSNGAGKTSYINAITWCLTGYILRSQRPPETADQLIPVNFAIPPESLEENNFIPNISPVTPVPSSEVIKELQNKPVPLDTWVELSFVDDEGVEIAKVKRSISRTSNGKIQVNEIGFEKLQLSPIAKEIGTKIPALIPYIRLDEATDMGKAVAALTGIKPLENLTKHSQKVKERLSKDQIKICTENIQKIDKSYLEKKGDLEALFNEKPEIRPKDQLPSPDSEAFTQTFLNFDTHFDALETKMLLDSKKILGDTFDPKEKKHELW